MSIPEADWRALRKLEKVALERFCERVLQECASILGDTGRTAHERYLALYDLTRDRDRELSRAFDDLRRSTAVLRLMAMRDLGVITDEELEAFSPETRRGSEPFPWMSSGTRGRRARSERSPRPRHD
jgi:hypothetical protein